MSIPNVRMFTMSDLHLAHSGLADSLILLIFTDFPGCLPWVSLWIQSGYDSRQARKFCLAGNDCLAVWRYEMFKNRPVTQSSWHVQVEEEANMAASSK